MYLMNIIVPGMLYHGPVMRQVLSWADVRRPPLHADQGATGDGIRAVKLAYVILALDHRYH